MRLIAYGQKEVPEYVPGLVEFSYPGGPVFLALGPRDWIEVGPCGTLTVDKHMFSDSCEVDWCSWWWGPGDQK